MATPSCSTRPPRVAGLHPAGITNTLFVSNLASGEVWHVMTCTSLVDNAWQTTDTFTATSSTGTWQDVHTGGIPVRYYRLRRQE